MFTWTRLQSEVGRWVQKNFPESPAHHQIWGLVEELGELTHAMLKSQQGIRGDAEKHTAAGKDAVADSIIFFMSACTLHNWTAQEVLRSATPEEFQATFSIPPKRSAFAHTIFHLAHLVTQLEDAASAPTALECDAYTSGAQRSALLYVSGLAATCTKMGWSLQDIIEDVWPNVRQRDWTKNKVDGVAVDPDDDLEAVRRLASAGEPLIKITDRP